MAKGYWVVHVEVSDMAIYQTYRDNVGAVLAEFGGRFIVRAGTQTVVEGAARPRCVVIEFPDLKAATDCYHGPAYQALVQTRLAAASADLVIVEGWDAP
tara:strand:- start:1028 stop:1324 length:297 start_codon:yes stop_codon:yes gene_type:complete